jgi:hypothetical protein
MDIRQSPATSKNRKIIESEEGGGNAAWLAKRARTGAVVFLGGAALADFRVRVAQSSLRRDLLPSFWSIVGLMTSAKEFLTVPLATGDDASVIPASNAIRRLPFSGFDDTRIFPNVGIVQFADPGDALIANVEKLMGQRSAADFPSMLLPWLGFVWSAGGRTNPLLGGTGLPSAALVEAAHGMAGVELTPGLASGSSCPEAIWQSALWWHDYYRQTAAVSGLSVATDRDPVPETAELKAIVPAGEFRVLQKEAAVRDVVTNLGFQKMARQFAGLAPRRRRRRSR